MDTFIITYTFNFMNVRMSVPTLKMVQQSNYLFDIRTFANITILISTLVKVALRYNFGVVWLSDGKFLVTVLRI